MGAAGMQGLLDADSGLAAGLARAQNTLCLDEADRLLEPSFEPELRAILSVLPAAPPNAAVQRHHDAQPRGAAVHQLRGRLLLRGACLIPEIACD